MLPLLLLSLLESSSATPSVWQCPVTPYGPMSPFQPRMGEICPGDSFIHYYYCCEDNPFNCCFYLETWAIVALTIIAILLLACCLFGCAFALMRFRRDDQ